MRFIFTKGWSRLKEITAFYVNRRKRSKCLKFASKWVNLFSKSRFKQSVSHLQFLQCTFFAGSLISMIWCLFRANSTIFRYFAVNLHFCQSSSPLVYHLVNKKNNKFNAYEKRAYFFKFSRDVFFFYIFCCIEFRTHFNQIAFVHRNPHIIRRFIPHCNSIETLPREVMTIFLFFSKYDFFHTKNLYSFNQLHFPFSFH